MAINFRRFAVPDDSITAAKLADNAVTTAKLADSAVVSAKLADAAVDLSTAKVGGILPVAKAHDGLRLFLIMADDTPISSTVPAVVDQWEVLKESRFSKKTA